MNDESKKISKLLSLVLRHQPEYLNLSLDQGGWCKIDQLIKNSKTKGVKLDFELLQQVVEFNDKKRFDISMDQKYIRANQGHSISVDLNLKVVCPPAVLYHGTVNKYVQHIQNDGIKKMSRQYVHLSETVETAVIVAQRRGQPIILKVNAKEMFNDGINFYKSKNGVWLTDFVDAKYINIDE